MEGKQAAQKENPILPRENYPQLTEHVKRLGNSEYICFPPFP